MKLILTLPLLLKLVDEILVWISTEVDLGNAENDLSSAIDFFNLVVSVKIQFWSSFIRNLVGYPNHEKSFNDDHMNKSSFNESVNAVDSFKNEGFVKSISWDPHKLYGIWIIIRSISLTA